MDTEIRLKRILGDKGWDKHGIVQTIARDIGINRHTVSKMYYNQTANFSMDTIGRICEWLEGKELCEGLPGALFAARPSKLMQAMAESGRASFYVGEYRSEAYPRLWTARDDAAAAFKLIHRLSRAGRDHPVRFTHVNVPSHVPLNGDGLDDADSKRDKRVAVRLLREMRAPAAADTAVLIGSPRANYLTEVFVSDLFGCRPFDGRCGQAPFYLKYHEKLRVPSCCGGETAPNRAGVEAPVGIYYRGRHKRWQCMPSVPCREGAGMAIVRRDPGLGRLELAVFGLSAIATAVMGKLVSEQPSKFWPPSRQPGGVEVGIYVCGFSLGGMDTGEEGIDQIEVGATAIEQLDVTLPGPRKPAARRS